MSRLPTFQVSVNNCATCDYKKHPDGGHCYMFRTEPEGVCMKHTRRGAVLPADSEPFPVMVARNEWECSELAAVAADLRYLATQKLRDKQRLQETVELERGYHSRAGWCL